MEVHSHTHTARKKWTHYLWEFLMLFLAVFCGFLAENIREHKVEKEKEKQAIESLVKCLASDTIQLKHVIDANIKVVAHLDSLIQLRNADLSIPENKRKFLIHSLVGFSEDWYFRTNDAAIQQLKSSGLLRLIRKQNIIDSIFKYDFNNKALVAQEADCYNLFKDAFFDYKKAVDLFIYRDTTILKYGLGYDNSAVEIKNIDAVQLSADKEKIKILFGNAGMMAAPDEAYINLMQDQLVNGKTLIAFLKKEYHLE